MLTTIIALSVGAPTVVATVWAFIKKVWPIIKRVNYFVDDWFGEPEREGRSARPGVLSRLQGIEDTQLAHSKQFEVVLHELFPNSGGSLRDEVKRTEVEIAVIKALIEQQNRG
jgi:hypothetical protein